MNVIPHTAEYIYELRYIGWGQGELGNILAARGTNAVVTKTSCPSLIKVSKSPSIVVSLLFCALVLFTHFAARAIYVFTI